MADHMPKMKVAADSRCYTSEWSRTQPDFVLYLSAQATGPDGYNDHLHVGLTQSGDLFAIWTQVSYEAAPDLRVVFALSWDEGRTWSAPREIAGTDGIPGLVSCFSELERISIREIVIRVQNLNLFMARDTRRS